MGMKCRLQKGYVRWDILLISDANPFQSELEIDLYRSAAFLE